jgi:hypothetical protein
MRARASTRAALIATLLAAGCSDSVHPPLPSFTIAPANQWSGGTITIRSSYFANRAVTPVIVAAAETLALSPIDDSTARTQLPQGPSEPVAFLLARGKARDSLGTVNRVGFSARRTIQPALYGELLATDSAGDPRVFGGTFTGTFNREPIVRLNVVAGQSRILTLRQPSNTQYGMAPSVIPGAFTVRDATDSLRLASLLVATPVIVDSMHWAGTGFTRHVSLLQAGSWLMTTSHWSFVRFDTGGTTPNVLTESPWAVYMSPRGDRTTLATAVSGTTGNGVPVFDNGTGAVAYVLPLLTTETAAFSPDGATLYAAGGYFTSDTLVAVNAATGQLLREKVRLPAGFNAMGMAYRQAGDGQLLVGATDSTRLVLLVYRASTLELLGVLPTLDGCPLMQAGPCFSGVVSVDEAHNAAYIVTPESPTTIWKFDLLSGP